MFEAAEVSNGFFATQGYSDMSSASLNLDGKSYELPVIRGTENETAVDITKLLAQSGAITMDPGFNSTGACQK